MLLPCPFCGEPPLVRPGLNAYGHCETKGCFANRTHIIPLDDDRQVDAWNRRHHPDAAMDSISPHIRAEIKNWTDTQFPKDCRVGSGKWVDGLTRRILAVVTTKDTTK